MTLFKRKAIPGDDYLPIYYRSGREPESSLAIRDRESIERSGSVQHQIFIRIVTLIRIRTELGYLDYCACMDHTQQNNNERDKEAHKDSISPRFFYNLTI